MRLGLVSCALALACASCASARRVPIEASFARAADGASAVAVVLSTHDDPTCAGPSTWSTTVTRDRAAMAPPSMSAHVVGVSAVALDARCHVVAEACVEADLATTSGVVLVLVTADRACRGDECSACRDAGAADGGLRDVGGDDAATLDATSDADLPDACEREVCDDGTDNDCDGFADCTDSDCASRPACQSCTPMPCP